MISYAQNAEDVLLARALSHIQNGFYIDVGANHPIDHSVTKHFYDLGWHGINIEPVPHLFAQLQSARPRDINLNLGLLDNPGSLPFFEVTDIHGWSTFSLELAHTFQQQGHTVIPRTIPVRTLRDIFHEFVPPSTTIDFLKIDVEGMEFQVLKGADFTLTRPRIILLEIAAESYLQWQPLLLAARYHFAFFDGINRYYIREEDTPTLLPHFAAPVNCLDDYIPHRYHQLQQQLAAQTQIDPATLKLLTHLHQKLKTHPHLRKLLKRLFL